MSFSFSFTENRAFSINQPQTRLPLRTSPVRSPPDYEVGEDKDPSITTTEFWRETSVIKTARLYPLIGYPYVADHSLRRHYATALA